MNVLVTSTTFIPSVLLCGHCQLDYLEKEGKLNYRFVIAHFINSRDVKWADTIVFLRSDDDINAYVSKIAKRLGKHTIYVLDDDILNAPSYLSSAPYYHLPSTQNNIQTIMKNCDTFLTPSPVLLEKYGDWFKYKFNIAEPSLNRINKKPINNKVKIGFAGSIDRAQDINVILEDAITQIVDKYGDSIEIEFMGAKPNFVDRLGLTHLPYQDGYEAYTAFMSKCNWDIGLAPMPKSDFHRCKYFNKYVEYASFGIVGIYSNLEPYIYGIKDGVNGLLVENTTEAWVNAISKLIEDEKLRREMSDYCLKEANDVYALDVLSKDYLEKLMVGYEPAKSNNVPSLSFSKFILFFKRIYRKIKSEGKNFPTWFKKKIEDKTEKFKLYLKDRRNLKKLNKIIDSQKTVCVIAPMFDDSSDPYTKRVKLVDEAFGDIFRIYISGEDRLSEHLIVDFIDDKHAYIVCNSFDVNQSDALLDIIKRSKNILIHSVIRFMREKISTDMYKLFEYENVNKMWDTHGLIPEEYHASANYHTEKVTNDIEKVFYDKCDVIISDTEVKDHFESKYQTKDKKYIIYPSKDGLNKINSLIK